MFTFQNEKDIPKPVSGLVIPHTLAEAMGILVEENVNQIMKIDWNNVKKQLNTIKIEATSAYSELAKFPSHAQGLALNKISLIEQQLQQLIEKIEKYE